MASTTSYTINHVHLYGGTELKYEVVSNNLWHGCFATESQAKSFVQNLQLKEAEEQEAKRQKRNASARARRQASR